MSVPAKMSDEAEHNMVFQVSSTTKASIPEGETVHNEEMTSNANLAYNDDEIEPEFHARTYYALAAMFLLNMVQVLALQGPPAVV